MNEEMINNIIKGDVLEILPQIKDNTIDVIITDPPYFLDKLDNKWQEDKVSNTKNCHVVTSLPAGMKYDKEQGKNFYAWYINVSKQLFRVLKPGGYFFSFSSPRLYHRMTCAIEDAGFDIKDCFMWLYTQNQPKAMSLNHFIDKLKCDFKTKQEIKDNLDGWKTPQIKSCFEPIVMAQKPYEETFLNNIIKNKVGLINTKILTGKGMFPANVMTTEHITESIDKYFLVSKPKKEEKGLDNKHRTVKPLDLCKHLVKLTAFSKDAIILDPFIGSGTTAVAAKSLGKRFIGIDINEKYVLFAKNRLNSIKKTMTYDTKENSSENQQLRAFDKKKKYTIRTKRKKAVITTALL